MRCTLAAFIFLVITCSGQSNANRSTNGGLDEVVYKLGPAITQTEYRDTVASVREFIWKHWTSTQGGKLKLEYYTKEGERTISRFEIKVMEDSSAMDVNIEREYVDRNPKSESYRQHLKDTRGYSVAEIIRIRITKTGFPTKANIPPDANVSGNAYLLRLKDREGKVLSEI